MATIAELMTRGVATHAVQPGDHAANFRFYPELPAHLKGVVTHVGGSDATWMNARDTHDLDRIVNELPTLSFSIEESQKRLFGTPFEITLGGLTALKSGAPWKRGGMATAGTTAVPLVEMTDEFRDQVVERFWMPFLKEADTESRKFGVVPFVLEPIPIKLENAMHRRRDRGERERRTHLVHYVPRVLPRGSGRVGTRLEKTKQILVWEWAKDVDHPKAGQIDRSVLWMVEQMPTLDGRYRSQLSPLLHDWRYITEMRDLDVHTALRNAEPGGLLLYKPDVARGTGSSGGTTASGTAYLESAGRTATYPGVPWQGGSGGAMPLEQVEDFRNAQLEGDNRTASGNALVGADLYTASSIEIDPDGEDYLLLSHLLRNNPAMREQIKTKNAKYPARTFPLRPYEEYQPLPPPRPAAPNLLQHMARLDRYAAIVAGYPLDQVAGATAGSAASSGTGGTNSSGSGALASDESTNRYVIAHLRARAKFYSAFVRDVYLQAYNESFRRAKKQIYGSARRAYKRSARPEEIVALNEMLKVDVVFPRVPLVSTQDMAYFYSLRMIDEEDFFRFSMNMLGLDDRADAPAGYKKAVQAHFPAVPLEMQQLELQRKAQEAQIALQKQQHELAVTQQRDQTALATQTAQAQTQADRSSSSSSTEKGDGDSASRKRARSDDDKNDKPKKKKAKKDSTGASGTRGKNPSTPKGGSE